MGCLLSSSKLVCLPLISGPNNLNLFQPVDPASSTQSVLNDVSHKLVLFYNSKVSVPKLTAWFHCNAILLDRRYNCWCIGSRFTLWGRGARALAGVNILCHHQSLLLRNVNRINPNRLRLKRLIPIEHDFKAVVVYGAC